jgi:hypothetical protein
VFGSLELWANFALVDKGIYYVARSESAAGSSIQFFNFANQKIRTIASIDKPVWLGLSVSPQVDQVGSDLVLVENFQ